ncbi:Mobile element protein [Azospirillum argentinense]|uniref:Integrase catalytic domain-containing protein n=1 Tax=Azospirillum argentinense TaxID=2970906 RepID=A0A5B0KMX3_9PROT|nr:Mobile element protein [Azospirillum argentinense]
MESINLRLDLNDLLFSHLTGGLSGNPRLLAVRSKAEGFSEGLRKTERRDSLDEPALIGVKLLDHLNGHLRTELPLAALTMALQRQRPAPGLLHPSDRGCQYASAAYRKALKSHGITPSMSRKGNCWDNAPMESFFGSLKSELVHHRRYATREDTKRDLFGYIEGYYNRQRLHSAIGYITPEQAERQAA